MNSNKINSLKETNKTVTSLYDLVNEKYEAFLELGFGFNIPLMIIVFGISAGVIGLVFKFFGIDITTKEAQYARMYVVPTLYFFRKFIATVIKIVIDIILIIIFQINKIRIKRLDTVQ